MATATYRKPSRTARPIPRRSRIAAIRADKRYAARKGDWLATLAEAKAAARDASRVREENVARLFGR